MYPQTHFLVPLFLGLILAKFNLLTPKLALIAGIIGALVDIDHYIEYIIHTKKNRFSIKAMWNNSIKFHKFSARSFIHHWRGISIISILLGIYLIFFQSQWQIALTVALGYYSHILLDHYKLGRLFHKKYVYKSKIIGMYVRLPLLELVLDLFCLAGSLLLHS
jgi:hypothetical protein